MLLPGIIWLQCTVNTSYPVTIISGPGPLYSIVYQHCYPGTAGSKAPVNPMSFCTFLRSVGNRSDFHNQSSVLHKKQSVIDCVISRFVDGISSTTMNVRWQCKWNTSVRVNIYMYMYVCTGRFTKIHVPACEWLCHVCTFSAL